MACPLVEKSSTPHADFEYSPDLTLGGSPQMPHAFISWSGVQSQSESESASWHPSICRYGKKLTPFECPFGPTPCSRQWNTPFPGRALKVGNRNRGAAPFQKMWIL